MQAKGKNHNQNTTRTSTQIVAHTSCVLFSLNAVLQYAHKIQCNFIACPARQVVQWAAPKYAYAQIIMHYMLHDYYYLFFSFVRSSAVLALACACISASFFPSAHLLFYIFHWQFGSCRRCTYTLYLLCMVRKSTTERMITRMTGCVVVIRHCT